MVMVVFPPEFWLLDPDPELHAAVVTANAASSTPTRPIQRFWLVMSFRPSCRVSNSPVASCWQAGWLRDPLGLRQSGGAAQLLK